MADNNIRNKADKKHPQEFECDYPYSLSYSGSLRCENESERPILDHYLQAWSESVRRMAKLFQEMLEQEPLLAYLIIVPKEMPLSIRAHPALSKLDELSGGPGKWKAASSSKGSTYALVRSFAAKGKSRVLERFDIAYKKHVSETSTVLTANRFEHTFELFPGEMERADLSNAVAGIFRSFLSNSELAEEENRRRDKRRDELNLNLFFRDFDRHAMHITAWGHCSRTFIDLRKELRDTGVQDDVIRACQAKVASEHPEVTLWRNIIQRVDDLNLANENPAIVQEFRLQCPSVISEAVLTQSDLYRRFGRKAPLRDLAKDVGYLVRFLEIYNDHYNIFPDSESKTKWLYNIQGRRPTLIHQGWLDICAETKNPQFTALKTLLKRMFAIG